VSGSREILAYFIVSHAYRYQSSLCLILIINHYNFCAFISFKYRNCTDYNRLIVVFKDAHFYSDFRMINILSSFSILRHSGPLVLSGIHMSKIGA